MTKISDLPLITSPEQFFNTDKFLFVDVLCVDQYPRIVRKELKARDKAFEFNKMLCMPINIQGSPENFILKKEAKPMGEVKGYILYYEWKGDLDRAIKQKHLYDLSNHYQPGGIRVSDTQDFFSERFVIPYIKTYDPNPKPLIVNP